VRLWRAVFFYNILLIITPKRNTETLLKKSGFSVLFPIISKEEDSLSKIEIPSSFSR
jgi:hypothetical protein